MRKTCGLKLLRQSWPKNSPRQPLWRPWAKQLIILHPVWGNEPGH